MVLLDAQPTEAFEGLPAYPASYSAFRRISALLPSLARLGVGQLVPPIVRCLSQHATSSSGTMHRRGYTAACATSAPNCPHRWHKPDRLRTLATDRWSS